MTVAVDITNVPLSMDAAVASVSAERAGGVVAFVGVVRDHDGGTPVASLDYSAHPSALGHLQSLADRVASRPGVVSVYAAHRVGHLDIGEAAVVLAVSAEHRGEAFEACRDLIDELKASVPIWKHQRFADGRDEWVGTP